jgi:hypothetical protein
VASSGAGPSQVKKDKEESPQQVVAEKVSLPSEIILEILSRLPARFLYRFLLTSKAWHTVISSDKKLKQAFAGFFYHTFDLFREPKLMRSFASVYGQKIDPSLDFLPIDWDFDLVDICNGLLLCRCNKTASCNDLSYIVCNPVTKRWIRLPSSLLRFMH